MAYGEVYNVREDRYNWFVEKLDKLAKKVSRFSDETITHMAVGKHIVDDMKDPFYKTRMVEVFVAMPEMKLSGWEFVSRIDHSQESGNIIRSYPGRETPERYRNAGSYCEHCNVMRRRRDTYIVCNEETGEYKQVGSSCLKDFLGHGDAEHWANFANFFTEFRNITSELDNEGLQDHRVVDALMYAAGAAQTVMDSGEYVSKKMVMDGSRQTSTADLALSVRQYTNDAVELAQRAIADILKRDDDSEFVYNAQIVAKSSTLELRQLGFMAAIVGMKYREETKLSSVKNEFYGNVGDKITIKVKLVKAVSSQFSVRHEFQDDEGHFFTWFSSLKDYREHLGKTVEVKATIKAHNEFRGMKQTLLTRAKISD